LTRVSNAPTPIAAEADPASDKINPATATMEIAASE
jgi:hypothetical protein